jgi:hypothetical protein
MGRSSGSGCWAASTPPSRFPKVNTKELPPKIFFSHLLLTSTLKRSEY